MDSQQYLVILAMLIPIVMFIVEFLKNQFSLKGDAIKWISLFVSGIIASVYCIVFALAWWTGVLLAIGLCASACGGFDLVRNFITLLSNIKKP